MTKTTEPNRDKHLTYFKVENFKRFESFEMDNIGHFNLIVGDNNVGKTSLLEVLLFDGDADGFYQRLGNSLNVSRGFTTAGLKRIEWYFRNFYKNKNEEEIVIEIGNDFKKAVLSSQIDFEGEKGDSKFFKYSQFDVLIPYNWTYSHNLVSEYSTLFSPDLQKKYNLIKSLTKFIPGLSQLEPNSVIANSIILVAEVEGINSVIPIGFYGTGTIKVLRYLIEITKNAGSRLMIDEIDNGVHYSKLKDFWKTILHSAKTNNVQLFMTTHSKECLEYYKEALEDLGTEYQEQARVIELNELKDKSVRSITHTYDRFARSIELENEIRGGY